MLGGAAAEAVRISGHSHSVPGRGDTPSQTPFGLQGAGCRVRVAVHSA